MTRHKQTLVRQFEKAAELLAIRREDCCCDALHIATNHNSSKPYGILESVFFEDSGSPYSFWAWWEPDEREARIQALLLCAELIKSDCLP